MTLCWLSTYVVVPPLLVISEKVFPFVRKNKLRSKQWEFILYPVGSLVCAFPRLIAGFGLGLAVFCAFLAARFLPNSLEYNFSKLKNRPRTQQTGPSMKSRVRKVFGENISPAIIAPGSRKTSQRCLR